MTAARVAMNVPKSIFRQYDVRGLVGTRAHARVRPRRSAAPSRAPAGSGRAARRSIAVGRDNRPSGRALAEGVRRGIVEAGGTAVDVGTLPTPALYFAVHALETDGGVPGHRLAQSAGVQRLQDGARRRGRSTATRSWSSGRSSSPSGGGAGTGRETGDGSVLPRYRDAIVSRHRLARPVRVVVDCGNGVGQPHRRVHARRRSAPR